MVDKYRRDNTGYVYRAGDGDDPQVAVIDPENVGELERLKSTIYKETGRILVASELKVALTKFMNPVRKPAEPKNPGAIVQQNGGTWVRLGDATTGHWIGAWGPPTTVSPTKQWSDFQDDVKIVHEGWVR